VRFSCNQACGRQFADQFWQLWIVNADQLLGHVCIPYFKCTDYFDVLLYLLNATTQLLQANCIPPKGPFIGKVSLCRRLVHTMPYNAADLSIHARKATIHVSQNLSTSLQSLDIVCKPASGPEYPRLAALQCPHNLKQMLLTCLGCVVCVVFWPLAH
jgi:hypothetical protein